MATEFKGIRIEVETIKFLKKQANKERRTFSGIVNKILKDYQEKQPYVLGNNDESLISNK